MPHHRSLAEQATPEPEEKYRVAKSGRERRPGIGAIIFPAKIVSAEHWLWFSHVDSLV